MLCLPSILFLFSNKLNTFNNAGARMLDSLHYMTIMKLKVLKNRIIGVKKSRICHFYATLKWT